MVSIVKISVGSFRASLIKHHSESLIRIPCKENSSYAIKAPLGDI